MKYSAKTIRTLIRLKDGDAVNEGEFRSGQMKELLTVLNSQNALSFVRIGRSRGAYKAITPERFTAACVDYDRTLSDLEAALRLAENEISSRAEKVALFGNSKQDGADRTVKGFTLIADRELTVSYLGRILFIGPLTGLHVVDRNALIIPKESTVIMVENAECFYDLRWIPNIGLKPENGPYIIMCRFPICEEGKLWLESLTNRLLYFGDFDLAGIRIYETEFKRRLANKISFIVPKDIESRIRQSGNPDLYSKQVNEGLSKIKSESEELTDLLSIIHRLQSSFEQEGYCF